MRPDAELAGFSVQALVQRPQALELIVGASVDATFGPVLLFGQDGTAGKWWRTVPLRCRRSRRHWPQR